MSAAEPTQRTLVQQRMELDRGRNWPIAMTVLAVLGIAGQAVSLAMMNDPSAWDWTFRLAVIGLLVGVGATGVVRLVRARGRVRAFEQEHGKGAGRQEPIR